MKPLDPASPEAVIIAEEQELLMRAVKRIASGEGDGSTQGIDAYDAQMIALRDQVSEAKPEDIAPLVEQLTRMQAIAAQRGRARSAPVDPGSPYFAHIRLREVGDRRRDVLIGKRGFIDRKSGIQIVDWRNAPVSRIYYRYDEGDDFDETFEGGNLQGEVEVRRNVAVAAGRLRRVGCPQGTFTKDIHDQWWVAEGGAAPTLAGGQGKAARPPRPQPVQHRHGGAPGRSQLGVHSGNRPRADKHLPEIAALIDREQFDLITRPQSGLVLIQGGAGSGKTTVALHRVAYLNFEDSGRFKSSRMLVVVPSEALVRYVGDVLPSLGVSGVPVVTYRAWARSTRRRVLPKGPDLYTDDTPAVVSRLKKHPAILKLLERHVAGQVTAARADLATALDASDVPAADRDRILQRWDGATKDAPVPRVRAFATWLDRGGVSSSSSDPALAAPARARAEIVARRLRRRMPDIVRDWGEILTDGAAVRAALAEWAPGEFRDGEIASAISWCLAQQEEPDRPAELVAEQVDQERFAPVDGGPLSEPGADSAGGKLDVEDEPILLRLAQLKLGGLISGETGKEIDYEHIAIDEAQDLSPIEVKVLLEAATPQRCITIAGDVAQRLVFDNSFSDWRHLFDDAGLQQVEVSPLKLSYRSTYQVMELANAVLGPLAPTEQLVARDGAPVEMHQTGDMGETVAFLADALRSLMGREPTASVALLSRHPEQADAYFSALGQAEVPSMRRVRRQDFAFKPGIDVTDIAQVKGLEFDYVLLLEVTESNYPATTEARHLLHIGATRAAHQLWLLASGKPSPLLPDWLTDPAAAAARTAQVRAAE